MKTKFLRFALKGAFLALLSLSLTSCFGSDTPEPDPGPDLPSDGGESVRGMQVESPDETIDMPETAVFVMGDINSGLVSYDPDRGVITFNESDALNKADIKVGDVLYSAPAGELAPQGYILKVTGIQKKGGRVGQVVYTVEEVGLEDAFDHLETKVPFEMERLSEDDFTVWDPFDQADQTDNIMHWPDDEEEVGTKSGVDWFPDFSIGRKWDKERYDLKIGPTETTLKSILYDLDGNYKTVNDQMTLTVKLSYDADLGDFYYTFDKKLMLLGLDFTPEVGISAELSIFRREAKAESEGEANYLKEKRAALDDAAKKLIGKKFCIMSFNIPVGAASIFVDPHVEVYLIFKLDINGEISVEAGLEKFPIHMHAENVPYTAVTNYVKSGVGVEKKPKVFSKLIVDVDLEGKAGLGAGIFCNMPKLAKFITDKKDVDPYIGFFIDGTVNGKASAKLEGLPAGEESTLKLHAEAFAEVEGYFKLYAHFKKDLIWNDKLTLASYRWPEKEDDRFTWDTTLVARKPYPVPYGVSPEHRAIVLEDEVDLQWQIPLHFFEGTNDDGRFDGLSYAVYLGTDRALVAQGSPQARMAQGLEEKTLRCPLQKDVTYYWKIVCTNGYGWDYESPVYSFDTGYDGVARLNKELARYLRNHPDVLYGVKVEEDGSIYRTPSNTAALLEVKDVRIKDPDGKYTIKEIDDLLMLLPGLTDLDCSYNHLNTITLLENPLLEHLVCTDNELKMLPLQYTPRLEALKCSNNPQLRELDFKSCPELGVLTVDNCGLEYLDLTRNTQLDGVYASDCALDSIDVSRCPKLLRLDFHGQSKERVKLRLTHAQKEQFSLFRPHVNTDYEYVDVYSLVTDEAFDITATGASIPVTILVDNYLPERGLIYTYRTNQPEYGQNTHVTVDTKERYFVVTLEGLEPDTQYYARGYARNPTNFQTGYGNVITFRTKPAEPSGILTLGLEEYDFGKVFLGESGEKDVIVKNTGSLDLTYEIVCPQGGPFSATPTGRTTLGPGDSLTVTFSFSPTQAGEFSGEFVFRSDDPRGDIPFAVWGEGAFNYPAEGLIEFADPLTKQLCVTNWDTDGNGELSYAEAAAVTSLNGVFEESKITSFDELQYFVNLTSLEKRCFSTCENLSSIILPPYLTSIGEMAFSYCRRLPAIVIPNGVTVLDQVFSNCTSLKQVTLPESLNRMSFCFYECTSLSSIVIPSGVDDMGYAFWNCSSLTDVNIPESVTKLYYAFVDCTSLTDITIPVSVANMKNAFSGCRALKNVTIVPGLKSIGESAFYDCISLVRLTVPEGLVSIGKKAFNKCENLSDLSLPSTLESIGEEAFKDARKLESFRFKTGLKSVGQGAFSSCRGLKSVVIEDPATDFGYYVFLDCYSLESVKLPEGKTRISESMFYNCVALKNINIPSSLTAVEAAAFRGCRALEEIVLPSGVTSVGNGAFEDCRSLRKLVIPMTLTTIPYRMCYGCYALEHFDIPPGVTKIPDEAFYECNSVDEFIIPSGVTYIGDEAFAECSSVKHFTIPAGVNAIKKWSFLGCVSLESIVFQGPISSVADEAFRECPALEEISLRDVTSLGGGVFRGCSSLKKIVITGDLPSVPGSLFYGCSSLVDIDIPLGNVTSIGGWAFAGCSSLTSFAVPSKVTTIGDSAFEGCGSLVSLTLPDGLKSLGKSAIASCGAMKSITIPGTVESVGRYLFQNCSSLETVRFNKGATRLPQNGFKNCGSLANVYLPEGMSDLGYETFESCVSLKRIVIPEGVTAIPYLCFWACTALEDVQLPNSLTLLDFGAFNRCSALASISLPANVTSIGSIAFGGCTSLNKLWVHPVVPPSLESGFNADTEIYVPSGSLSAYKSASGWKNYADRIYGM